MTISSRTPEGSPNRCDLCGRKLQIEPSLGMGDAPCPAYGHLLWFMEPDERATHRQTKRTTNEKKEVAWVGCSPDAFSVDTDAWSYEAFLLRTGRPRLGFMPSRLHLPFLDTMTLLARQGRLLDRDRLTMLVNTSESWLELVWKLQDRASIRRTRSRAYAFGITVRRQLSRVLDAVRSAFATVDEIGIT